MVRSEIIWFALAVPFAAALILTLISERLGRLSGAFFRAAPRWGVAAAIMVGYAIVHVRTLGVPMFVPESAEHVAAWGALFGVLIAIGSVWVQLKPPLNVVGRVVASLGVVWLVMRWKMTMGQWTIFELALWSIPLAALLAIVWGAVREWGAMPKQASEIGRAGSLAVTAIVVMCASMLMGYQARLISGSTMALALSAALGGVALAWVIVRRREGDSLGGIAPVITLVLGPLVIDAVLRSPLQEGYAALVFATPLVMVGARAMLCGESTRAMRRIGAAVAGLSPLLVVTAIELVRFLNDGAR